MCYNVGVRDALPAGVFGSVSLVRPRPIHPTIPLYLSPTVRFEPKAILEAREERERQQLHERDVKFLLLERHEAER